MVTFHESNIKRAIKNLITRPNPNIAILEFHMGLGDNLVCIGLVRELVRKNPQTVFYYPCPKSSFHTISWIYHDLKNIYPFAIQHAREIKQFVGFMNGVLIQVGHVGVDIKQFDASFYAQHNVPFEVRWTGAKVAPGPQSEALYDTLNPLDEAYILVCTTQSGGKKYSLNIPNPRQRKVIEVHAATPNLYDWMKLTLRAEEIHTIDTSYVHFVESVLHGQPPPKLFYHLARPSETEFTRKLPWTTLTY